MACARHNASGIEALVAAGAASDAADASRSFHALLDGFQIRRASTTVSAHRCLRRRLRGYTASVRASGAYVGTAFHGLRRRLRAYVASSGTYGPMTYAPSQVDDRDLGALVPPRAA